MTSKNLTLRWLLERLTGQPIPLPSYGACEETEKLFSKGGLGYSQFNELLLLAGYDRVQRSFFQYLVDGTAEYMSGAAIKSLADLSVSVDRFLRHALFRFGNVKYAFKYLITLEPDEMAAELAVLEPIDVAEYKARHAPVRAIEPIAGSDTYYLGYLIKRQLDDRLKKNPRDAQAKRELKKREELVARGIRNHESYLASDHMDVYVATSMRERHEYFFVNQIAGQIFGDKRLKELQLRWFDPTQAYCHDRIDKGLSEALMLKRAKCTLYFAQETDTLGKDSELASTLAQGKTVIAYIPEVTDKNERRVLDWLLDTAKKLYPEDALPTLIMRQLQVFDPQAAWHDSVVQGWLRDPRKIDLTEAKTRLIGTIRAHYNSRANLLKESHPLGIQVHLETGVANGVLVARTARQCADLIYRVVTNSLEFSIEDKVINNLPYLLLRESTSGSVFRVVTGDALLTNTFWNFYRPR